MIQPRTCNHVIVHGCHISRFKQFFIILKKCTIFIYLGKGKLGEQKPFYNGPWMLHEDRLHLYFQYVVLKALIFK